MRPLLSTSVQLSRRGRRVSGTTSLRLTPRAEKRLGEVVCLTCCPAAPFCPCSQTLAPQILPPQRWSARRVERLSELSWFLYRSAASHPPPPTHVVPRPLSCPACRAPTASCAVTPARAPHIGELHPPACPARVQRALVAPLPQLLPVLSKRDHFFAHPSGSLHSPVLHSLLNKQLLPPRHAPW